MLHTFKQGCKGIISAAPLASRSPILSSTFPPHFSNSTPRASISKMETAISTFCKSLASFCNHVQISSQTLSDSLQRRPIPLESAASSFVKSLDRRISSTGADLNLLDSMAFGTISVEELLGHCNEVYKANQKYISLLEDNMAEFGYVPELEVDDEDLGVGTCGPDENSLLEDSISLQNLGLSDVCLATLASQDNVVISSLDVMSLVDNQSHRKILQYEPPKIVLDGLDTFGNATVSMIEASKGDYGNLPSYMKSLASWEELQEAVVKMNSYLCKRGGDKGSDRLDQDDLEKLGLGCKAKSYLLLLIRMNQLVVETVDGSIFYRVRV